MEVCGQCWDELFREKEERDAKNEEEREDELEDKIADIKEEY